MEKIKVNCPHCGQLSFYSPDNEYRPFCSARCKLIDLGQWANESYKIPTRDNLTEVDLESIENSSDDKNQDSY